MKNKFLKISVIVLIIGILISNITIPVLSASVAVTGITLNKSEATVNVGKTYTLSATVSPSNATDKTVSWKSSNSNIASVKGGKVTAKASGTCTITATSSNGKKATCKITVPLNTDNPNTAIFDKDVINSTVWPAKEITLYKEDTLKTKVGTLATLTEALVVEQSGADNNCKLKITAGNKTGWVDPAYLMINLPDVRSDIIYNITNAYSSIFKIGSATNKSQIVEYNRSQSSSTQYTEGSVNIPNLTGKQLYTYDNDGTLDGKVYNAKLGRYEFVCPVLYKFAVQIGTAQNIALKNGYCLKIYDAYRPQEDVCDKFWSNTLSAYNSNQKAQYLVDARVNGSTINGLGWFVARPSYSDSDHAKGVAIDVTMVFKDTIKETKTNNIITSRDGTEIPTQSDMHDLSTNSLKNTNAGNYSNVKNWGTGFTNMLNSIMTSNAVGMLSLKSEWWHYNIQDSQSYTTIKKNVTYTDKIPLTATITKTLETTTTGSVKVTIEANKQIQQVSGWSLSEDKTKITKNYTANTNGEVSVKITDISGKHSSTVKFNITNIDDVKLEVNEPKYSTYLPTKEVTVTLEANKEVQKPDGWNLSEDGKILTKTYTSNVEEEKVIVKDKSGNKVTKTISIENICKEVSVTLIKSTEELTNEPVQVKLISNTGVPIEIVGEDEEWGSVSRGVWRYKFYDKNTEGKETLTIRDSLGNTKDIEIEINNIDTTPPEVVTYYETKGPTNKGVAVKITANEEVHEISGWEKLSQPRTYRKVYEDNYYGEVVVTDLAGNTTYVDINIKNIDKDAPNIEKTYSTKDLTNGTVTVTLTSDEPISASGLGWNKLNNSCTLKKTYNTNTEGQELVTITDLAGNEVTESIEINNIDKEFEEVEVIYSDWQTNSVDVMLKAKEPIQSIDGWSRIDEDDECYLIKTYYASTKGDELITVKDMAGNEQAVIVNTTKLGTTEDSEEIVSLNPQVKYSIEEKTKQDVTVEITVDRAVKEVEGWTLSDDEKTLTKTYEVNKNETITLTDATDETYTENVAIKVKNIDKAAPNVTVEYSTVNTETSEVTVTLISNEPLNTELLTDWELIPETNQTIFTKVYPYATFLQKLTLEDLVGNEQMVQIEITAEGLLDPSYTMSLNPQVEYSIGEKTNQNVTVTITVDRAVKEIEGWTLSEDGKTLTKIYEANNIEEITLTDDTNEGYTEIVVVNVNKIDKSAPNVTVEYSTVNAETGNVTVTLKSNEPLNNQLLTDWSLIPATNQTIFTKQYNINTTTTDTITVKDLAGNEQTVQIDLSNAVVTKVTPTLQIEYSTKEYTNEPVKVTINVNIPVKPLTGWEISEDEKTLTKYYESNNYERITLIDQSDETNMVHSQIVIYNMVTPGDVNLDGKVDFSDFLMLKRYLVTINDQSFSLSEKALKSADVNKDGEVNVSDLLALKRQLIEVR